MALRVLVKRTRRSPRGEWNDHSLRRRTIRLKQARVKNYRSIRDTGWFDVEGDKTILVGPNEAGKTVLLRALQQINPPTGVPRFDPLRDFPRSELSNLKLEHASGGTISPGQVTVVEARFELDDEDEEAVTEIDERFAGCSYIFDRRLDGTSLHRIDGGPAAPTLGDIRRDLLRLAAHADAQASVVSEDGTPASPHTADLNAIVAGWRDTAPVSPQNAGRLRQWLDGVTPLVDEANEAEEARLGTLSAATAVADLTARALAVL